jgi:tetratricopeptide (TPR) repeat protein
MKPKLFVGSSREALDAANAIHENLRHDVEVTVWNHGIFNLSQSNLESLLDTLNHMNFGVFVFAPDDIVEIRGEQNAATRDNVVFELGLFIGRLGRERSFIFLPSSHDDLRLPTDLLGVTPGIYESNRSDENFVSATAVACNAVRRRIAQLESPSQNTEAASTPQQEEESAEQRSETTKETKRDTTDEDENDIPEWIVAYFDENYEKAITLLEKKIGAADREEDVSLFEELWLGKAKAKVDFRIGIEYLENKVTENSEDSYGYIVLSDVYKENGLYDDSVVVLERGLKTAIEKQPLLLKKASLLADLNDTEAAKRILNSLIDDDPGYEPAYSKLGKILIEKGLKSEARNVYESGLKILPGNEDLLSEYAHLLMDLDENEATLTVYKTLTNVYPTNTHYLTFLGNVYLNLGLNGLALEAYEEANEIAEEKEGWILANIGNLYKNRGFYPKAITYLKKASDLVPDYHYAYERLAQAIEMNEKEREQATNKIREHKRAPQANSY